MPETKEFVVFDLVEEFFAVHRVCEESGEVQEGGVWGEDQSEEGVSEDVFQAWAPAAF